ncbi:Deoxyribose-phosphate aldolase 1 [Rubripirellula lacrimiformis]|uniref:Deoxyribose-phosphate aldolase n=1 Tax=Rubripirellula lacrimiformis TaxID=1930273 RepID=A0A517NBL3_9BACT|nr:deoxyribose-phosphate aldolase [Rubripirellula lacrimiformis]QDT04529.1 Deoxyribose-phosphate aldolase 1 [Rubripirellula lacrimiformis]
MASYQYHDASKMIDHALLNPTLSSDALESGCRMAAAYDVASVCIMPYYLSRCVEILAGTTVLPSTVIGFPLGAHKTSTKVAEAKTAVADGAIELDMVVNISAVLSGNWRLVQDEIQAIVDVAHADGRKVKVIFENCYLQDDHKIRLCQIAGAAGADWVKTSTGFGTGGATMDDLKLMIAHTSAPTEVKAAGGVRDLATLMEVRSLGVTRVGASATAAILDPARAELGLPPVDLGDGSDQSGY